MRFTRWALLLLLACALAAVPAVADTMMYTLNNPNTALSAYAGPYGTLTVTLDNSTTATISIVNNTVGPNTYLFFDSSAFGLNTNGAATVLGSLGSQFTFTVTSGHTNPNLATTGGQHPAPQPPTVSYASNNNVDNQGDFNLVVTDFDGFTYAFSGVTFQISLNSGTWANAAAVLAANNLGNFAEVHVIPTTDGGATNAGLKTGFSGATPIPEPASLALFGGGLIGLGTIVRKRHFGRS